MSSTQPGSGLELEKFPDAPPTIAITAPEEVPHAGLRSLDHCMYFHLLLYSFLGTLYSTFFYGSNIRFHNRCCP